MITTPVDVAYDSLRQGVTQHFHQTIAPLKASHLEPSTVALITVAFRDYLDDLTAILEGKIPEQHRTVVKTVEKVVHKIEQVFVDRIVEREKIVEVEAPREIPLDVDPFRWWRAKMSRAKTAKSVDEVLLLVKEQDGENSDAYQQAYADAVYFAGRKKR